MFRGTALKQKKYNNLRLIEIRQGFNFIWNVPSQRWIVVESPAKIMNNEEMSMLIMSMHDGSMQEGGRL